jgi:DNA-binding XRE family transcriptional regulator
MSTTRHARGRPPGDATDPPVPDLLLCTFDRAHDHFHVVYADLSRAELPRSALAEVGDLQVEAWEIDGLRRGVEVALEDGTITSFSAELPRYLSDPEYRRRVDARRAPAGEDLRARVASRVRAARLARGWTVAELGRRAGMAAPNVHRLEAGAHVPSMATVARLAAALELPLARLVAVEAG